MGRHRMLVAAGVATLVLVAAGLVALPPPVSVVDTPIALSSTTVEFGAVNVGGSATEAVVVTNTSSSPFGPLNMFGGAPFEADFSASQNCVGVTLAPGGTCSITYVFSPSSPGPATATSTFTISATPDAAAGEEFTVALSGQGTNPIALSSTTVEFGAVNVGGSATEAVVVTNTSSSPFGPLNMVGGAPFEADFSASQNCVGATLAPGGTCSITYVFSPSFPGPATATSTFTISATPDAAAGEEFTVALSGCGTPPACSTPTGTFGNDGPVAEGGTATVAFTGVSDPISTTFTYSYDFGDDGTFDVAGSPDPSAVVPAELVADGPATVRVRGRISNDNGGSIDLTTDVVVTNVAPSVSLSAPASATAGEVVAVEVGASDPSAPDEAAGFDYVVDWGDGTTTTAVSGPADLGALTHTYPAPGTYTVSATATDGDGAVSAAATASVVVVAATTEPPEGTTTTTTTTIAVAPLASTGTGATGVTGVLPRTGVGLTLAAWAALLVAVGAATILVVRRRAGR